MNLGLARCVTLPIRSVNLSHKDCQVLGFSGPCSRHFSLTPTTDNPRYTVPCSQSVWTSPFHSGMRLVFIYCGGQHVNTTALGFFHPKPSKTVESIVRHGSQYFKEVRQPVQRGIIFGCLKPCSCQERHFGCWTKSNSAR